VGGIAASRDIVVDSGGAAGEAPPLASRDVTVEHLAIRDFRNLERVALDVPHAGVAIVGENGHGKTNLLEAVYYLELLRSMRGARDVDLVRFGAPGFHIAARVAGGAAREVSVGFERQTRRKKVVLDGGEPQRLSDALGAIPSVILAPRDVGLVAGAPTERRRFLDVTLALTSRAYLSALQHYRGALLRRNAALRDVGRSNAGTGRVSVWEPALAEHGALLLRERARWVERHAADFTRLCAAIGERGESRLRYVSTLASQHPASLAEAELDALREALLRALEVHRSHDVRRGITHVGPHRDDLDITLTGRPLRTFGSAGQQRTAAIALRLLESATLRERLDRSPVVLLDDPFAELDSRRAHRILELLGSSGVGQTILAVPRVADIPPEMTSLERRTIRDGVLEGGGGAIG
jgi:DNA replication and repair protein RecF